MMRKMQTPAYCPALCGVNAEDQSGVVVDVKNTIFIESMPIMDISEPDVAIGSAAPVDDGMGIDIVISMFV